MVTMTISHITHEIALNVGVRHKQGEPKKYFYSPTHGTCRFCAKLAVGRRRDVRTLGYSSLSPNYPVT